MTREEAFVLAGIDQFTPPEKVALWECASGYGSPFSEDLRLCGLLSLSDAQVAALIQAEKQVPAAAAALEKLEKAGDRMLTFFDEDYPAVLRGIEDPPFAVFVRGKFPEPEKPAAAIVGARACTEYGIAEAERFGAALAAAGIAVISGMAFGVDAAAHRGALQGHGYTLAILGCGIDICYPKENYYLSCRIAETGGLLSEYPPATPPRAYHFPQRNRLISAFASCILVMEARFHSGSLITAGHALAQNRDVFALPGRTTDPLSEGTNHLIEQGAGILLDPESLIRRLLHGDLPADVRKQQKQAAVPLSSEEKKLLACFDRKPITVSDLCAVSGMTPGAVSVTLMMLQHKGRVKEAGAGYFRKA